jgi:hypothetical protein
MGARGMTSIVIELLGLVGSLASLIGLYWTSLPSGHAFGMKDGILLALSIGLAAVISASRIVAFRAARPIVLRSDRAIRDYMYKWISSGSQVMIFSHDLTWIDDERMMEMLRGKARRRELSICLRAHIPAAIELSELGASIFTYGELGYIPTSRFTIINRGRYDAHVAIGRSGNGEHVVREIASGQDPLFALANDLAEVVMKLNESQAHRRSNH